MPQSWFADILDFRRAMGFPIGSTPTLDPEPIAATLIPEEYEELVEALTSFDITGTASEAIDLVYVVLGVLAKRGIDPQPIWDAIHAANMAKASGPRRADGKVLKPPGWQAPDIAAILASQPPLDSYLSENADDPAPFRSIS